MSKKHPSNICLAKSLVDSFYQLGVVEVVLCSGNRNVPLIYAFSKQRGIKCYYHFNEYAAAYFALGRIKLKKRPVAVVVTSGTAALQLGAAAVEAYYSALPLILVSADLPREFRGSAAPQSIDQRDLFAANLKASFDIESIDKFPSVSELSNALEESGPVHINLSFTEPLIDKELKEWQLERHEELKEEINCVRNTSAELASFLAESEKPLVIAGRVPEKERERVTQFLLDLECPLYAEALSGIREESRLTRLLLKGGERVIRRCDFDAVLRIGSVPVLGFWRELERNLKANKLPVLSISSEKFSGLARESKLVPLYKTELKTSAVDSDYSALFTLDKKFEKQAEELYQKYPHSEPAVFRTLSKIIEPDAHVYLGNSMAIRLWDMAAEYEDNSRTIEANRGVNGIDGQLSTFFGACDTGRVNWCIIGDLTALYDLSAPYILNQLSEQLSFRIVIINNYGGRLFERLPDFNEHIADTDGEAAMIQPHESDFSGFAKMWELSYQRVERVDALHDLPEQVILEVNPDLAATREFWKSYNAVRS